MIRLLTENKLNLTFNYSDLMAFLDYDERSKEAWYGISIQIDENQFFPDNYKLLQEIFATIVNLKDIFKQSDWYILHDYKLMRWFFKGNHRPFPKLSKILTTNGLSVKAKRIINCNTDELLFLSDEIVSYPSIVHYPDLNIISAAGNLILKSTAHITIDVITTDSDLSLFIKKKIKEYKGIKIVNYNVTH